MDNEINNVTGSSYTSDYWQYDSRLGRRWNVDPMTAKYAGQSPFSAFNNNPIYFNDPLGLEGDPPDDDDTAGAGDVSDDGEYQYSCSSTCSADDGWKKAYFVGGTMDAFEVDGGSAPRSWTSEIGEFDWGGTNAAYEKQYGLNSNDEGLWEYIYGDEFRAYRAEEIQKARDRAVVEKLGMWLAPFKGSEELKDVAFIYATMGIGGSTSMGMGTKTFSYTPRGMNVTVFRNFGPNELAALKANGMNFEIGSNFGSKQFWLDEQGLNWWKGTSFSKPYTATITIEQSALRSGYRFMDAGKYRAISYDSQRMLNAFNKGIKSIKVK